MNSLDVLQPIFSTRRNGWVLRNPQGLDLVDLLPDGVLRFSDQCAPTILASKQEAIELLQLYREGKAPSHLE